MRTFLAGLSNADLNVLSEQLEKYNEDLLCMKNVDGLGRKNWLFSNTANGANASAALYSIISTAQANGLDAEKYLTEPFSKPAGTILMPWREENERGI